MPKRTITPISEAESRVMDRLWGTAPQGSKELTAALYADTGWHENTVRTLLSRLVRKRAVRLWREGRRYRYAPLMTREQWQTQETRNLLDRVFGGRVAPLLAHLSEHEKLSADDLAELRKLVDKLETKERDGD